MGITQQIGASSLIKPGVIDDTAARPASPYEGQVIYQKDTDAVLVWNGTAWYPNWNIPWGMIAGVRSTGASTTPTTTAAVAFVSTPSFTPLANRIYRVTWAIGIFIKNLSTNNQDIYIRVGSATGTIIDHVIYSAVPTGYWGTITKTTYCTSTELGTTSSTTLWMTVENNGTNSAATFTSDANTPSILMIEDIGPA
jgi:hypothetical protein